MILVTGATGRVGRHLVQMLAAEKRPVRVLTRDRARARFGPEVEVFEGDYARPASVAAALDGADKLYLMFPIPGNLELPSRLAKVIGLSAVSRIVMLSSLSTESQIRGDVVGEAHRRAEHAVTGTGKPVTLLRPGTFMSNCLAWAPQIAAGDTVHGLYYAHAAPIHERDVAAVARAALTVPGHERRGHALTGPEALDSHEQIAILGAALGRRLRFQPVDPDSARDHVRNSLPEASDPNAVIASVAGADVPWATPRDTVARVTGSSARDFRTWVHENLHEFGSAPGK